MLALLAGSPSTFTGDTTEVGNRFHILFSGEALYSLTGPAVTAATQMAGAQLSFRKIPTITSAASSSSILSMALAGAIAVQNIALMSIQEVRSIKNVAHSISKSPHRGSQGFNGSEH